MVRVILHGCNGAMGRVISELAKEMDSVTIVAGIDLEDLGLYEYPVYQKLEDCPKGDVMVDFSSAKAVDSLLKACAVCKMPLVLCTTGLSKEQIEKVQETSKETAILRSANMSLGINTLLRVLEDATKSLLKAGFDVEIVEKHHNRKADAPSGTALALADTINEAADGQYHYTYGRVGRQQRDKKEIGLHAVRCGTMAGEHEVIFAGPDEVITFGHTAYSKVVFAKGSLEAACFLAGKKPGLYTMGDVIGEGREAEETGA